MFVSAFTSIFVFLSAALAAPGIPRAADAPAKVGIYLCTDINWAGTCKDFQVSPGICNSLPPPFAGEVSCIGPDPSSSSCTGYANANCTGDLTPPLKYPGIASLQYSPFNDQMKSFICRS